MFHHLRFLVSAAAALGAVAAPGRGTAAEPPHSAAASPDAANSLQAATRQVLQGVVRTAQATAAMPAGGRPTGDALTELYVRQAARVASELPEPVAASAFLRALGIALDDSDILLQIPGDRGFCQAVESADQRRARLTVLGQPTVRGRHDLAQHFVVSCYLTAAYGRLAADAAGLAKELQDAKGQSGFSFVDLAADKAGAEFAARLLRKQIAWRDVADKFLVKDYVPTIERLPEGIGWDDFVATYGDGSDPRFQQVAEEIVRRIRALPPYHPDRAAPQRKARGRNGAT